MGLSVTLEGHSISEKLVQTFTQKLYYNELQQGRLRLTIGMC